MNKNQEDIEIVNYLLEKGEISIPTGYLDDKIVHEIGKN